MREEQPQSNPKASSDSQPDVFNGMRLGYLVGSVAWQIVVPFAAFLALGLWLDGRLGTGRILAVMGVFLSVPVSILLIRRTIRIINAGLAHNQKAGHGR